MVYRSAQEMLAAELQAPVDAQRHCIYCDSTTESLWPGIHECTVCGSLVSPDLPPPYEPGYHAYRFSFLRPKFWFLGIKAMRSGLMDLYPVGRACGTVCDIGCGAGHSLWWARHLAGAVTVGYDLPAAFKSVRGCDFFYHDMETLKTAWGGKVDLVWCWHTLEHAARPDELIQLAARLLAPDGKLYLEFPEANRMQRKFGTGADLLHNSFFPEHRGLPSKEWVTSACKSHGLKVTACYPPKNPCYLYLGRDRKTDLVVRAERCD